MRKFSFLKIMFVLVSLVIGVISVEAQLTEGFETGLPTSYSATTSFVLGSGTWTGQANGVVQSELGVNSGTHSCFLRSQTGAQITSPNIPAGGVSTVTFWASASTISGALQVNYSINGGVDWTPATGSPFSLTTGTPVQKTATINSSSSNILIQFYRTGATVYLDDIVINAPTTPSCSPSTLAFTTPTVNKIMTDAAFTQTATSLNGTTDITYASNNTDVANVNQTTGEVSLVGAGVTTITATQAAGTHNTVDYCAATATFTLNVTTILPTITVTEVTVPAMTALVGYPVSETVNISGSNLTNNIELALSGTDADQFNLSTNSLPQSGGYVANTAVNISYNPTGEGNHTANLIITSEGASTIERVLAGTANQLIGNGTTLNPYTVTDVKALNNRLGTVTKYWVLGYIIGAPSGGNGINLTTVDLEAPFITNSAIAISDTKNETDLSKMIGVQLNVGDIRNALNLVDNTTLLNKWVKVYGTLEGYFSGTPGVKNITDFLLESNQTGIEQQTEKLNIIATQNGVKFFSSTNEIVEIYNAVGQKLVQQLTEIGLNTIPVSARGVVLVKVGNRFAKVIL